jgi:serine/threonine protein kinase
MADVFRAHDELLRRYVAVKVFATDPDVHRRADREIRTLASLCHSNLVSVFDAGVDMTDPARPVPYLVMELIDGPTLAQRMAGGALNPAEAAELGTQIATGLSHIHDRGIVHRDIKPANILLAHQYEAGPWTAKITDFGIAQVPDAAALTMTGLTVGTASYVSPEQAVGQPIGPSSDIYSLGLVLLEALTGERAFAGPDPHHVALARVDRPPNVPRPLGPDWVPLLTAMTAQDPNARPDATDVASALQSIRARDTSPIFVGPLEVVLGDIGDDTAWVDPPSSNPERPISTKKSGFRRTRWIFLTALAAAITGMSLLAMGAVGRSHHPADLPARTAGPAVRLVPTPGSTASPAGRASISSHGRTATPTFPASAPVPPGTRLSAGASRPPGNKASSSPGERLSAATDPTPADLSTSAGVSTPPASASAGPTQSASAPPTSPSLPPPTATPDASPTIGASGTSPVPPAAGG